MLPFFRRQKAQLAQQFAQRLPRLAGLLVSIQVAVKSRHLVPMMPSLINIVFKPRRRILCKRQYLQRSLMLTKIFAQNRYRAVLAPQCRHDASVHLPTSTGCLIVNARDEDNAKTRVARAWQRVSGLRLKVDPTRHRGPMVEKSEANFTHDGRVLEGPLSAADVVPGKSYQKLIDNSAGCEVIDLRTPFVDSRIPFVYVKRRPLSDRFSNTNTMVTLRETEEIFSVEEQSTLVRMAEWMGLDFGEADVLRDKASGTIWVVDVTNGPAGPPNGLAPTDAREALRRLAQAYDAMLEQADRLRGQRG